MAQVIDNDTGVVVAHGPRWSALCCHERRSRWYRARDALQDPGGNRKLDVKIEELAPHVRPAKRKGDASCKGQDVKDKPTPMANWIRTLSQKKPFRAVSVALANKLARIA